MFNARINIKLYILFILTINSHDMPVQQSPIRRSNRSIPCFMWGTTVSLYIMDIHFSLWRVKVIFRYVMNIKRIMYLAICSTKYVHCILTLIGQSFNLQWPYIAVLQCIPKIQLAWTHTVTLKWLKCGHQIQRTWGFLKYPVSGTIKSKYISYTMW